MENKSIFTNLRKTRKALGISAKELASAAGIALSSYQGKELGYQLKKDRCNRFGFSDGEKQAIKEFISSKLFEENEQSLARFNERKAKLDKSRKTAKKEKKTYSRSEVESIIKQLLDNKVGAK